jgi:phenylacetate-CoA ligase
LRLLFEIIWKIGAKIRNPSLFSSYFKLKQSANRTSEEIESDQFYKTKELLIFAQKKSIFWKRKFQESDFNPIEDFNNLEDINKTTVITKKILLEEGKNIHTENLDERVFLSETSGTSGQVLKFFKNENWDSFNRAVLFYAYELYGVRPWDRNGYFWGFNKSPRQRYKIRFFDFLQNRFRLFSYEKNEVQSFLIKLKSAKYLNGYSSMIFETAKIALELGFSPKDFPKLKMIKGTSEKIFPFYQDTVIRAFGRKIVSEYGAAETGIIAYEYPCGSMHIIDENVLVETNVEGEAIVTNFRSKSFPIIRYSLGDIIKLRFEKCSCGRNSMIVEDIEGRIGKSIQGYSKSYPSLTLYYIFKNLALENGIELQYQGYQVEKGKLDLRFPVELDEVIEKSIRLECMKYFNSDVEVRLLSKYQIHTKQSKLRDFISDLN